MKAIALLSGGLDSTLAIRLVLAQGIDIEALNCMSPFCLCSGKSGCGSRARRVADDLGITLRHVNIAEQFIERVKSPQYSYGKRLNPCIDCRILMHRAAKRCMESAGAAFIVTGEVLGQRPKSQYRAALALIEKKSGLEGLVLRPLSAKLLPPSIPERKGWVDRSRLLGISGRSRRPQMALAAGFSMTDYPCPAGGCLLTDPVFSEKMRDLMAHAEVTLGNIQLLKIGRHFRLTPKVKIVVGRNEEENDRLLVLAGEDDVCIEPVGVKGPVGLLRGHPARYALEEGARIVACYCDDSLDADVEILSQRVPDGIPQLFRVRPAGSSEVGRFRIHQP